MNGVAMRSKETGGTVQTIEAAARPGEKAGIGRIRRNVVARYPWFGSVAASLAYEENQEISSLACDGHTLYYNPCYLEGLTPEEQLFVLAHEYCHVAFHHIERSRGKDPQIWKTATDAVVNQLLRRDGLSIIRGGIDYPEAIHYDAEQFYEILLQQKLEMDLIGGQMAGQPGAGEKGDGQRKNEESGGQEEEDPENPQGETDPEESGGEELSGDDGGQEDDQEDDDHSLWEEAARQRRGDEEEEEENLKDLVPKKTSRAGNDVSPDIRSMDWIGRTPPLIDWRLLLRDTINYGVDWSFTNATIEDGIVRPALEERPMPETEIVLDTSWSVEEDLLRNFLRECKNILLLSKLKAGCFDTVFYGFQDIRTAEDIETMTFEGGGGTDFETAVNAFTMRVDNRIIFTDGKAPMPETVRNVIWMVYGEEEIDPPGGTVIRITPEQLQKLEQGVR